MPKEMNMNTPNERVLEDLAEDVAAGRISEKEAVRIASQPSTHTAGFTPGPWKSRSGGNTGRFFVEHESSGIIIAALHTEGLKQGTNERNANLIAAAPAMAEALREVERLIQADSDKRKKAGDFYQSMPIVEAKQKARAALKLAGL